MEVFNQHIRCFNNEIELYIKREDVIHPYISGNKFRKLKYNLLQAQKEQHKKILSFGGAYSNHIAALAYAGQEYNFETIGIIRGEEVAYNHHKNPTLQFATKCGMHLHFVAREVYSSKTETSFIASLQALYGDFYLVPEGGTNAFAIKGCQEILTPNDIEFNYICCAVGTGGTLTGISNSTNSNQKIIGFPALKGDFLNKEIAGLTTSSNWELCLDYHFGGYGKVTPELIAFINNFNSKYKVPLDPIYTGKMAYGVIDLIEKGYFPPKSKILMIHTGGLQGIEGMNKLLKSKNLNTIDTYA